MGQFRGIRFPSTLVPFLQGHSREVPNLNSGTYAACAGLMAQDQALELAAHNLANLNTTGYRAQQPVFRSLLAARSMALNPVAAVVNNFGVVEGSRVDLTAGSLEATGNPLDLGIEGSGFFAVRTGRGTLYTRNGSFQVSAKGQLVTASGDAVMGESGAITLPAGAVSVMETGPYRWKGRWWERSGWRSLLPRLRWRRRETPITQPRWERRRWRAREE
jgi:hypothetical protein